MSGISNLVLWSKMVIKKNEEEENRYLFLRTEFILDTMYKHWFLFYKQRKVIYLQKSAILNRR